LLEMQKAICLQWQGSYSIPAEVYKKGGTALIEWFHQLFLVM
jgi:hypothetical protein